MKTKTDFYGRTKNGEDVYIHTLQNENGVTAKILEYGCAIQSLLVPDKNKILRDVVLGYNTLEDYENGAASHGSFVGRVANRIENSQFTIDEKTYYLQANDGKNHLHGTFGKMVYKSKFTEDALILTATSKHGDDGFPGDMNIEVSYALTEENALVIGYKATTNKKTLINLTNHTYFNLNGQDGESALNNILKLYAKTFTEGNAETCPTGVILPVENTPMDFTTPKQIGTDIKSDFAQIAMASGYDHNYVLDKQMGELAKAAVAKSEQTGIAMVTYTTQPGVQLYTGNFLHTDVPKGKQGAKYEQYHGFCLETQHFPCAPSHPNFPSIVLNENEEYNETTIYQFEIL